MKTYLKYAACASMGVIASGTSNSVSTSSLSIVPALEKVCLWDSKKGTLTATLEEAANKAAVTCLCIQDIILAAGYSDGKIRLWNVETLAFIVTFNGHAQAVTALVFGDGILVSGARDTDIIVWDLLLEAGLYRLRGHKDAITGLVLLTKNGLSHLASTSKDSLLKVTNYLAHSSQDLVSIDPALRRDCHCSSKRSLDSCSSSR